MRGDCFYGLPSLSFAGSGRAAVAVQQALEAGHGICYNHREKGNLKKAKPK